MCMCASRFVDVISETPGLVQAGTGNGPGTGKYRTSNIIISASSRKLNHDPCLEALSVRSVISGTEYYVTNNSRYTVVPGNYLILNNGSAYSSHTDPGCFVESFTVHFGQKFISRFFAGTIAGINLIPEQDNTESSIMPEFIEKTYLQDDKTEFSLKNLYISVKAGIDDGDFIEGEELCEALRRLLYNLITVNLGVRAEINSVKAAKQSTRAEVYKRLNYARDFMESSYSESISVENIASVACMNTEYFIRQFRNQFGITPVQFLIAKRMKAAGEVMKKGNVTVSEVCRRVGYTDLSSFGKLFKRYYGIGPDAYLKSKHRIN